jgi:hypothetical protein
MGPTMPYYKPEDLTKLQENLGTIARLSAH